MFAVPGWTLGKLKTQSEVPAPGKGKESKKRKRREREEKHNRERHGDVRNAEATTTAAAPVAIPAIASDSASETRASKRPKKDRNAMKQVQDENHQIMPAVQEQETKSAKQTTKANLHQTSQAIIPTDKYMASEALLNPSEPPVNLTPLQAAMRQKLVSARFRHLNQTLYTTPSSEALALFESNQSFFDEYHSGFRQQVSAWPENPVDGFVAELRARGSIVDQDSAKGAAAGLIALPRTRGICTVADLGCGDASMAEKLSGDSKKLSMKVLSYDLQKANSRVTKADIANLPLNDGAVNVAIFCLALMGTNWIDSVEEAWRVLHWKGELFVAEIRSRFAAPRKRQVDHSVGKRRKATTKGADVQIADAAQAMRAEVEGGKSSGNTQQQTDVSGFVEVLRRRGFTLRSKDGIEMSNKMFVKMRFIKALTPSHGRHAEVGATTESKHTSATQRHDSKWNKTDAEDAIDVATVLKPCLYKHR